MLHASRGSVVTLTVTVWVLEKQNNFVYSAAQASKRLKSEITRQRRHSASIKK